MYMKPMNVINHIDYDVMYDTVLCAYVAFRGG